MKRGEIVTGVTEKTGYPNRGLIYVDGKPVTVKGARPGETVEARIRRNRPDSAEAALLCVTEPSPLAAEDPCPHAAACGGCYYQGFPVHEQRRIKEEQVTGLLRDALRTCEADPVLPWEGVLASPLSEGYRNKMEFSFGDAEKGGDLTLGLHKKNSFYDVVSTPFCRLCDPDMRLALQITEQWARENGLPFYHKREQTGYLRHLLVRRSRSTGELLAALVTTGQTECLPEPEEGLLFLWAMTMKNAPFSGRLTGLLHMRNDSPADVVRSEDTAVLYGQDHIEEELLGLRFRITPFSFFQTNTAGAEVLYSLVRDFVGDTRGKRIFDLYSGTGTIAQILAPVAERVTGVEIVPEAVEAARANAQANGLSNCDFLCGDVLKVLDDLPEAPDILVLDPPRDGIHPKALPKLLHYGAERIVYVSCKPTSLARDLPSFLAAGYRPERCAAVDMFPFTTGIETVCLLSNTQRPKKESYITLDVEMEDHCRIKNEGKNSTT